jgi:hypothetical protein
VVGLKTELVVPIETFAMESVNMAEEYIGKYGWGPRGRHIGLSRMFGVSDKSVMATANMVASVRPRGILSGFLVIVPCTGYAMYIPPVASKTPPFRVRLRIPESVWDDGAVFSAYLRRDKRLVLEDILVWQGKPVWNTTGFSERWKLMGAFLESWSPDKALQGLHIEPAIYMSLASITEPDEHSVLEFVPQAANQKRLIWMPSATQREQPKTFQCGEEKPVAYHQAPQLRLSSPCGGHPLPQHLKSRRHDKRDQRCPQGIGERCA